VQNAQNENNIAT